MNSTTTEFTVLESFCTASVVMMNHLLSFFTFWVLLGEKKYRVRIT